MPNVSLCIWAAVLIIFFSLYINFLVEQAILCVIKRNTQTQTGIVKCKVWKIFNPKT